jgi:hypothetical protein
MTDDYLTTVLDGSRTRRRAARLGRSNGGYQAHEYLLYAVLRVLEGKVAYLLAGWMP